MIYLIGPSCPVAQVTTFLQKIKNKKKIKSYKTGKNKWESNDKVITSIPKLQQKGEMIDFSFMKCQICDFFMVIRGIPILKCIKTYIFYAQGCTASSFF